MTDEELIAEARRLSPAYRHGGNVRDKHVGWVLLEMADRLEARPAPQAETWAFCKRCRAGTASVQCPECGGPACAVCGRCPPCHGDLPGEEDSEAE